MHRSAVAAIVLISACTLAGCSDPPEPKREPSPTAPLTNETTSANESASSKPATGGISPEQTVRHWVSRRNALLSTGDPAGIDSLASDTCSTCDDQVDPLVVVIADGGRFQTKGWTVVDAMVEESTARTAQVSVALDLAAGITFFGTGEAPARYEQENRIAIFDLVNDEGSWLVDFIGFAK